jgi:hypothetical protein
MPVEVCCPNGYVGERKQVIAVLLNLETGAAKRVYKLPYPKS